MEKEEHCKLFWRDYGVYSRSKNVWTYDIIYIITATKTS